uniref:Putative transposase n=1 Tax=Ralstonia solanacearum CFBP2957 TaxID=859656 RepID=D8P6A4_RALSL
MKVSIVTPFKERLFLGRLDAGQS